MNPQPRLQWSCSDRQTYWVEWRDQRWTLRATPGEKCPWRLSYGVTIQGIGPPEIHDAQGMAEFWLETRDLMNGIGLGKRS